jgi:dTDP-glucose pyrophosphorylase
MNRLQMTDWTEFTLSIDSTVYDAIRNLNDTGSRIVLVTSPEMTFEGVVVDGDIRRGLLKGATLDDKIANVINRDARVVLPEISRSEALKLMEVWNVSHIPIVNSAGLLCGVHSVTNALLSGNRPNTFLIMAGGFGTRMGVKTTKIPKPMLEVAGKPMLEHLVLRAKNCGFIHFAISIHHQGNVIEDYFRDGTQLGIQISYLREQRPMGTAGSLTLLSPVPTEPVLVCNGDLVSKVDFGALLDFHVKQCSDITIAVQDHELQNPFGVVDISEGKVIEIVEKPVVRSKICAGIYVLEPSVIAAIPGNEPIDMPFVLQSAISQHLTITPFQLYEDWMDVGRETDLIAAEDNFSKL